MRVEPSPDELVALTAGWTGDRFPNGRPRVADDILQRLRSARPEHVWDVLDAHGYGRQFTRNWRQTRPGQVIVGRAVTARFLPRRPDHDAAVVAAGAREGHHAGDRQNTWVIDSLTDADVMVTDIFGKIVEGTVVGDNLGTALAARTRTGAVIDGGVRDLTGLEALTDANIYYRGYDPSPIKDVVLAGLNTPVLIDGVTVLPGDVVLGTAAGVTFFPPQLAEEVCATAERVAHRDRFGQLRLAEGVYTSADIDVPDWAPDIQADYEEWSKTN